MAKEYIIGQEYLDSQNQKKTAYFKDAEAVSTTEVQQLTDVQKNTARNNIGASSLTDFQIAMSQLIELRTKDNFITKNLGYTGTVMAHGEARALQAVTSGDASIAWVVFTYGDENSPSTAMIHQKHGETTTVQTMFFGNIVANRTITFTDSTRTSIESTTAWGTVTRLFGVQATQTNIVLRLMNSHLDGSQGLYMLTLPALTSTASGVITPSQFASLVNGGDYDSNSKSIRLKHDNTVLASIDATAFIKDGMVSNVAIRNGQLVIVFNTDAGKEDIRIPLTEIFNPDNYYTKTEINNLIENNDKVYVDDTVAIHSLPEGEIAGEVKEALVAFRANEANGKSLVVFKHGTNTGIVATVESWGSSFGMWFFYNGKFCRVTADHSDELWEAHWVDLENAVQPDDEDYIELQEKVTELEVNAVRSGVFDLSKYNAVGGVLATYADLSAALTALNALDSKYKYGGMSFKFVQSSDNKYVQYRLMAASFTTNKNDWQGVDDELIPGSNNLVKSGVVYKKTSFISSNEIDTYDEKVIIGKSKEDSTVEIEHQKVSVVGSFKKNNHEVVTEDQLDDYYTTEEVDEKIPFEKTDGEDYTERIVFGESKSDATMIVDKDSVRVKSLETLEGETFIVTNPKELLRQNQWEGMIFAGYGDSITASFWWGDTIRDFFKFSSKLNRGIGGTSVRNYAKDSMVSVFPTGTQNREEWEASPYYDPDAQRVQCCQAMSSWSRIKASFPSIIKDDVRLVIIMGGTNDWADSLLDIGDGLLPKWSNTEHDCLYDEDWITDTEYNPEGGDFDTHNSFKGALASTIVKMQRWMPKARLVVVSQMSGRGVSGENATDFMYDSRGHSPLDYAHETQKVAEMLSTPYIPLFENVGVNQFNRKDFIGDEVHPYGANYQNARNGQSQIARVMIGALKNIYPYSETFHDEFNNAD